MDDPSLAWPAWKFGMKRDALFTTLHEQYNTFQSTIQDPEAFHHDVYDVAVTASTTAEFHRLMSLRREQRLQELNESLESAAFEIIANPSLVGSSQWAHALQLFRSRSLDSLVRYFSSYLPADHPWRGQDNGDGQVVTGHSKLAAMPDTTPVDDCAATDIKKPMFHDTLTDEPHAICCLPSLYHQKQTRHDELPPSPRSLTALSDDSRFHAFPEHHAGVLTPARTLTSDSNSVGSVADDLDRRFDALEASVDETYSQSSPSSGPDTPVSMSEFDDSLHVVDLPDSADSTDAGSMAVAHTSDDAAADSFAALPPSSSCSPLAGGLVDASVDCKPLVSFSRCSHDHDSTQPALALSAYVDDRAQPGLVRDCSSTRDDCNGGLGKWSRSRASTQSSPSCPTWSQRRSPRQMQKQLRQHQHRACCRERNGGSRGLTQSVQRRETRRAATSRGAIGSSRQRK